MKKKYILRLVLLLIVAGGIGVTVDMVQEANAAAAIMKGFTEPFKQEGGKFISELEICP